MKFYSLETKFTFGKYQGKTISEVIELQMSYLDWCIINLEHFYLSDEVFEQINGISPNFHFSEQAQEMLRQKFEKWEQEEDGQDTYETNDWDNDHERDNFDALTDGQYGDYDDWNGDWDTLRDSMGY